MKRILVFATGTQKPSQGGSGFRHLVRDTRVGRLKARVCGVVTPWRSSIEPIAQQLGIDCYVWVEVKRPELLYRHIVRAFKPDLVVLSGWLKLVRGLNWHNPPVVNIHPAPLPEFGGKGMYGLTVHEAVLKSGRQFTEVTVHRVNENYDDGDIIFKYPVPILPGDTPGILQERVKRYEHWYYGLVIQGVLKGSVRIELDDLPPPPDSWLSP